MPMPLPAHLAGQEWTPDRVQNELVREDQGWPRYELIDGELIVTHADEEPSMSTSPRRRHQRAARHLMRLLEPYVERHALGEVLMAPLDVRLTPETTVQPDVFVAPPDAAGRVESDEPVTAMILTAEVLSPSTAGYDRLTKRVFYARRGVPEYWVVDCDARLIEVSRPTDPRVELYADELRWHPDGAPAPLVIDVRAYFARVLGPA